MYKTTNMIMKNPIYLLSKNNATAVIKHNYAKSFEGFKTRIFSKITSLTLIVYIK